jgi:hypothetical protein
MPRAARSHGTLCSPGGLAALALLSMLLRPGDIQAGEARLIGLPLTEGACRSVVERPTLARALAAVRFTGTLGTVEWLLDRPPFAAALARHLHPPLDRYDIRAVGDRAYEVDDMGALRGTLQLVAEAPGRRIYLVHGEFRSLAHLLALEGRMVFALEYRAVRGGAEHQVEVVPQLFLRLDNVLAHGVMRVLGPLLHAVIDRRVAGLTAATQVVGDRIAHDAAGLYRDMRGWSDVAPADREAFRRAFLTETRP